MVSISLENKNVVFEEFIGIYCVYCFDGYLLVSNFVNVNFGDVVLINVYVGLFVILGVNEFDFMIIFGDFIDMILDVVGYLVGDVNCRVFSGLS